MLEFLICLTAEVLPGPVPLTLITTVFVPISSRDFVIADATSCAA
jgi:hypothetical protein